MPVSGDDDPITVVLKSGDQYNLDAYSISQKLQVVCGKINSDSICFSFHNIEAIIDTSGNNTGFRELKIFYNPNGSDNMQNAVSFIENPLNTYWSTYIQLQYRLRHPFGSAYKFAGDQWGLNTICVVRLYKKTALRFSLSYTELAPKKGLIDLQIFDPAQRILLQEPEYSLFKSTAGFQIMGGYNTRRPDDWFYYLWLGATVIGHNREINATILDELINRKYEFYYNKKSSKFALSSGLGVMYKFHMNWAVNCSFNLDAIFSRGHIIGYIGDVGLGIALFI